MTKRTNIPYPARKPGLARLRAIAAVVPLLIGAVVALEWSLGVPASLLPGLATMKFNTALALMLAGGGLLALPHPEPQPAGAAWKRLAGLAMGVCAALLGALTLAEYAGVPLGLDQLVFLDLGTNGPSHPGRMSPASAAGLACAGAAIVLLARAAGISGAAGSGRAVARAHLLAAVPAAIGYLSLAGYAYDIKGLYSFEPFASVAIHTAIGLVLLALSILLTMPDLGWRRGFADRPVALALFERLLPVSLAVTFIAGLVVVQGGRLHLYDARFEPALLVLVATATSLGLAWMATKEVRRAEGRMRASEAQFRSLVDTAADGIVVAHADGRIQSANRAMLGMFGYDRADELTGRNLGMLMPAAEALRHDGYIAALREGAPPRVIGVPGRELRATRRDGSEFPIDLSVSSFRSDGVRYLTGIIRDAGDRKRDAAALAEAEARFRGIFDSQFQHISLLAPDGTVLEVNRTALDACGVTRGAVIGRPFWQAGWWQAADRARLRAEIAQAAQGAIIRREIEIAGADGKPILIDFSLKPVLDRATGATTAIIAEGHDLTENQSLTAQLVQAQKVQALGQLAAGIAHDFNNILQAISGAALLMRQSPEDQDRTRHFARTVVAATERGAAITRRLLSFARRGELRAEPIDTAELLDGGREVLARTLGTAITVCARVPHGIPPLLADRAQLETALINLGANARDAMPEGGRLVLAAEAEQVAAGAHHPAGLAPGDYVRLSVADTGTGMDAPMVASVTEPFFTTKPAGQGTGLGLTMAKVFAEQSGGGLSIASAPGQGTTVAIWLRQATCSPRQAGERERRAPGQGGAARRILVVDDDDLVRETVAAQLEVEGFATLVASSGIEALALIEAGEVVDALVSDLTMPGMNGMAVIRQARALRPGLPCFLLTGDIGACAASSAEASWTLVRKPIAGPALAAQIMATLSGASR